jgi:hypothetical protein
MNLAISLLSFELVQPILVCEYCIFISIPIYHIQKWKTYNIQSFLKIGKDYAYGCIKVVKDDGTVINDGSQTVQLFRMPKQNDDPELYLNDPSKLLYRKGDSLSVTSLLCSTVLTQNSYVRSLLKWQDDRARLPEVLNRFTFGSQFEIIKFLPETFNAVSQILDSGVEGVDMLVYDAVIFVIGILVDEKTSRYTNFEPVFQRYIDSHFSSKTAHQVLLQCAAKYLENVDTKPQNVLATLKSFLYLLKILKKSLTTAKGNAAYHFASDTPFRVNLFGSFTLLNQLLTKTSPALIGAQTVLLKVGVLNVSNPKPQDSITQKLTISNLAVYV